MVISPSNLEVIKELRKLDSDLRKQEIEWLEARQAALSDDGQQTAEWWKADEQFEPVRIHGPSLLKYAREHKGSRASLICLVCLIDIGEGSPSDLYRSACKEVIAQHRNDPALSWLCSRCTNPLFLEEMRPFLIQLRKESTNPLVKAAATFHLAELLNDAMQRHGSIADFRETVKKIGYFEAYPEMVRHFETLATLDLREFAAERDRLLKLVASEYSEQKPWTANRTFNRLDYTFREDPDAETYGERVKQLQYEIANLRVGCIAPDFKGIDIKGRPFQLKERRGKPTLLFFTQKGCGACEKMYPALRAVQKQFSATGFSVIGIVADDQIDTIKEAVAGGDITWPCVWDGRSGPIAEAFAVPAYPSLFLLDGEGKIVALHLQEQSKLIESIEKIVRKK